MLGRLARLLRMCGYDAAYALDRGIEDDDRLCAVADAEDRLLLTRDAALARRVGNALCITSTGIEDQIAELRAAGFTLSLGDPTRCSRCNGRLEPLSGIASTPDYAPDPGETPVWRCVDCGQCYWRGSHWEDVRARLGEGEE